jgi:hypothetical protein
MLTSKPSLGLLTKVSTKYALLLIATFIPTYAFGFVKK